MTARPVLTVVLALVLSVAVGCGGAAPTDEVVEARSSPTALPSSAGARALTALQASVADLGAVEVSGGTPGDLVGGRIRAASDLRTGDFRVTVDLGTVAGADAGILRMVRHSDLTWTKAPPAFWIRLGYTAESARRAQGKWVVARAETIRPLVQSLDPGVAVRALLALSPADVLGIGTVPSGELRGHRVLRFRQGGVDQRVYLTRGARPRLLRIASSSGPSSTALDFLAFPPRVQVTLPLASDVLPPS